MEGLGNLGFGSSQSFDEYIKGLGTGLSMTGSGALVDSTVAGVSPEATALIGKQFTDETEGLLGTGGFTATMDSNFGADSMFGKGNLLGQGGALQAGLGIAGSFMEGLGMYDQHRINRQAEKYARKQNTAAAQLIAENKRKVADQAQFDAGWNIG